MYRNMYMCVHIYIYIYKYVYTGDRNSREKWRGGRERGTREETRAGRRIGNCFEHILARNTNQGRRGVRCVCVPGATHRDPRARESCCFAHPCRNFVTLLSSAAARV